MSKITFNVDAYMCFLNIVELIIDLKLKKLRLTQEDRLDETFSQRIDDVDHCLKDSTCTVEDMTMNFNNRRCFYGKNEI